MPACVAQPKLHPNFSLTRFREFLTLFFFPTWFQWVLEALDTEKSHSSCSTEGLRAREVGRKAGEEGIKVLSEAWNMWAIKCAGSKERVDFRKEDSSDLDWF